MIKQRTTRLNALLYITTDLVLVGGALALARQFERTFDSSNASATATGNGWLYAAMIVIVLAVFAATGLYRAPHGRRVEAEARTLLRAVVTALAVIIFTCFVAGLPLPSRLFLIYAGALIMGGSLVARLIIRSVWQVLWRRGIGVERVLVVGDGPTARTLMRDLLRAPQSGRQLLGCLTDRVSNQRSLLFDGGRPALVPIFGGLHDLDTALINHDVQRVIVSLEGADVLALQRVIRTCIRHDVTVHIAPDTYGVVQQLDVDDSHGWPLLTPREATQRGRERTLKRALDIVLSLMVLVPFGLLLTAVLAVLIKLDSPGPVFFRQQRLTRTGKTFWVYKFRTMVVNADQLKAQLMEQNEVSGPMFKMRHDPRLTRVGRWLRRTSLDELPQIFNILRGDMSWVGPRPPLPSEVELYEAWQKRRLGTTTGLTGLWQVSGRSLLGFEDMVKLDLYYIENWSIWLDLKILLRTIPAVLTGKGAF